MLISIQVQVYVMPLSCTLYLSVWYCASVIGGGNLCCAHTIMASGKQKHLHVHVCEWLFIRCVQF